MAEVQDQIAVEEELIAKKDMVVTDENGTRRKIVAGFKVPRDLREAAGLKMPKGGWPDTGTAMISDDHLLSGDAPGDTLPGDETKIDPAGVPKKKSSKKK